LLLETSISARFHLFSSNLSHFPSGTLTMARQSET
jgi:hypothetical protein